MTSTGASRETECLGSGVAVLLSGTCSLGSRAHCPCFSSSSSFFISLSVDQLFLLLWVAAAQLTASSFFSLCDPKTLTLYLRSKFWVREWNWPAQLRPASPVVSSGLGGRANGQEVCFQVHSFLSIPRFSKKNFFLGIYSESLKKKKFWLLLCLCWWGKCEKLLFSLHE